MVVGRAVVGPAFSAFEVCSEREVGSSGGMRSERASDEALEALHSRS